MSDLEAGAGGFRILRGWRGAMQRLSYHASANVQCVTYLAQPCSCPVLTPVGLLHQHFSLVCLRHSTCLCHGPTHVPSTEYLRFTECTASFPPNHTSSSFLHKSDSHNRIGHTLLSVPISAIFDHEHRRLHRQIYFQTTKNTLSKSLRITLSQTIEIEGFFSYPF